MSTISALNWRYATKRMNNTTVSEDKVEKILEAARLAPTSNGLQPFEIFVVTNQELKDKIKAVSFNQPQISECSHLLIFAAWDKYTTERLNHYFDLYERERELPSGFSDQYKGLVAKQLTSWSEEHQHSHASKQVYIALSFAMIEAAMLEVDCVPMEGFVANELDELLQLEKKNLKSVLLLPLGYRDASNDWQSNLKKVRKNASELIHYIK